MQELILVLYFSERVPPLINILVKVILVTSVEQIAESFDLIKIFYY